MIIPKPLPKPVMANLHLPACQLVWVPQETKYTQVYLCISSALKGSFSLKLTQQKLIRSPNRAKCLETIYIKKQQQNLQPKVFFFNFKLILKLSCVCVAVFISKPYHRFRSIIPGFERLKQNCKFAASKGLQGETLQGEPYKHQTNLTNTSNRT